MMQSFYRTVINIAYTNYNSFNTSKNRTKAGFYWWIDLAKQNPKNAQKNSSEMVFNFHKGSLNSHNAHAYNHFPLFSHALLLESKGRGGGRGGKWTSSI